MITTERLRCEPLTTDHADAMYPLLLDERIYQFLPDQLRPSLDDLRKRYQRLSTGHSPDGNERWLNWILFERSTERPIGFFQATVRANACSIAYVLNPQFWNRGYATEAAQALGTHLFEFFEITSLTAEINQQNEPSQRLVKRLGFSFVRHDPDANDDVFEITRSDWFSHNSSEN